MKIYICDACGAHMKEKVDACVICRESDIREVEQAEKNDAEKAEDAFMKAAMDELDQYDEGTELKTMKTSYRCPCNREH